MWAGAGIGAAVSLPVFLFYAGEDEPGESPPPAKRGFSVHGHGDDARRPGGGIFSSGAADDYSLGKSRDRAPRLGHWASLDYVAPLASPGGIGVQSAERCTDRSVGCSRSRATLNQDKPPCDVVRVHFHCSRDCSTQAR